MLPPISYGVSRERLERESPAYTALVIDAGNKDVESNIAFRKKVRDRCRTDMAFRGVVTELCRREPLFYVNTFCCIEEPRGAGGSKTLPFITYEYQDRFILDVYPCQGVRSTHTLKSRATGWTWMMSGAIRTHRFIFCRGVKMMVSSGSASMVDETDNPDTLMAKFDFVMDRIPWWMAPKYDITKSRCKQLMHRYNPGTRSVLTGAATTEDIGRGGRRTEVDQDELASWEPSKALAAKSSLEFVTDCVNVGSTPKGDVGPFRDGWYDDQSPSLKIELKWEDHPHYRKGMYTSKDEKLILIDEEWWNRGGILWSRWVNNILVEFTKDTYPFELDGELHSPWFDDQCRKLASPRLIAQELNRSFSGSDDVYFEHATILSLEQKHATDPLFSARIVLDEDSYEIVSIDRTPNGLFDFYIDPEHIHPDEQFVIGLDVASGLAGSRTSNSVISAFSRKTRKQVVEMASNNVKPYRLAEYANGLGRMLNNAMVAWEAPNTGQIITDRLVNDLRYPNVFYMRKNEKEGGFKLARSPGWWLNEKTKLLTYKRYTQAIVDGGIIVLSRDCYREHRQIVWVGPDQIGHRKSLASTESMADRKTNHGDRVSGAVLAFKCMDEHRVADTAAPKVVKPWTLQWLLDRKKGRMMHAGEACTPSGRPYGSPANAE